MNNDNYIKSLILVLSLLLSATVDAHDFEVNGIYYNIVNENEVEVTYQGAFFDAYSDEYSGSVTIPKTVTYDGTTYTVTSIGSSAFNGCTGLASIIIPNSVTSIGECAFIDCIGLTSIGIPNSVTSIGVCAFDGTAWYNNQSDGIVYAGLVAYKYKGLMPDGTNIILELGTVGLGSGAFEGCTGLTSIVIPNSVITIGEGAFYGCTGLISIEIPNLVTSINACMFYGCTGLTSIEIPNSVTSIGSNAFEGCTGLTSIEIPDSVTSIGGWAFRDCTELGSIEIGNSVSFIGPLAFYNCSSVNHVYCYSATPPVCNEISSDHTFTNYSSALHVPAASLAAYFTAPCWKNFENIIGDAVAPTGIVISHDSIEMQLGEQLHLGATILPINSTNKKVTWLSNDTTVATIDNGIVTAVSYGECDIIASCFGMQAICHVSVVNRITLEQQEAMLLPNHLLTLTPNAPTMPDGFTVTSSEPTVAAARVMNGKVQVVGIKEGNTTITVGSVDGTAIPATCLVTVYTERGDVNMDGFVNISDVASLIDFLLEGDYSQINSKNADVNGNGNISISDVSTLIDKLLSSVI